MTVGLLGGVRRRVIADAPVVPSILRIAMVIPQKFHSMIDDAVGAWPTHKMGNREGVNDSRGREEVPRRLPGRAITRRGRSPLVVEIMEAAKRIDYLPLEKRK